MTGPAPVGLRALDVLLEVQVEDRALRRAVGSVTVDLQVASTSASKVLVSGTGPWVVDSPAHRATATTPGAALSATLTAVNLTAVAQTPLLTLHTAVLTRGRRTLVVAGPSGRGKTTLSAALLLHGWHYVSDEALALPWAGGAPVPYPRALALSTWSRTALGLGDRGEPGAAERFVRAVDLGSAVDAAPAPVTDVVVLDAPEPAVRLEALHRQDALGGLLPRGFTTVRDPGRALVVLAGLLGQARTWRLASGPPLQTAEVLTDALQ